MILKWIKSIVSTPPQDLPAGGAAPIRKQKTRDEELVDVAHEALRTEAEELSGLIRMGRPEAERRRLKNKIKSKVKQTIAKEFDEPEIVEEVTERILNAAEFDPHYREMFDN